MGPIDTHQIRVLLYPIQNLVGNLGAVSLVLCQSISNSQNCKMVMAILLPGNLDVADQRLISMVYVETEYAAGWGVKKACSHRGAHREKLHGFYFHEPTF